MASEFITRVEHGKDEPYTVIFRTDDADKYKHIEDECRKMIGHAKPTEQPTVDAVPVEWIRGFADRLCAKGFADFAAIMDGMLKSYFADGERKDDGTTVD